MNNASQIDVAAIEQRHKSRLLPWVRRGISMVSGKLQDARAHAEKAITDTLRTTPDGRASAAITRRNPSFQAALNRLDELWTAIGGPAVTSLNGFVQDASVAFYRDSRELWWDNIRPDYRVDSKAITNAQEAYVRGLLWYGVPVRQDFARNFQTAKTTLLTALGAAGSTQATNRDGYVALRTWEGKTRDVLIKRVGLALIDAGQRADSQAMIDTILPEHRPKQ